MQAKESILQNSRSQMAITTGRPELVPAVLYRSNLETGTGQARSAGLAIPRFQSNFSEIRRLVYHILADLEFTAMQTF
ncbi:MAG TPA: hypothetical protein VE860_19990 [Chthoniobacterales bacterium]|nr:hypothetical protein [Chthoniobacterales bacterium]